jgi:lipopolysaccharide transport system ATP-binding protein
VTSPLSAVALSNVNKTYWTYERPSDRMADAAARLFGKRVGAPFPALDGVNLEIAPGQATGLIGRNGAGKSTLLQIIAGTLQPTTGTVTVSGRIAAMIELGAGFNPEFTGRENIQIGAALAGLSARQTRTRMESILDFAEIGDFIDQPVKIYSSGMFARLAFAVSAHVDADILVVDEILSVGDAAFNRKCADFIERFKQHGTVIFTSHSMAAVQAICQRAVWLDGGRVRADGPAEEICARYLAETTATTITNDGHMEAILAAFPTASAEPDDDLVEIYPFDPAAPWFGQGGARIVDAQLFDAAGERVERLSSRVAVEMRIECVAEVSLSRALIGFSVRDERGQPVFGQNTHITYEHSPFLVPAGGRFRARFGFVFPRLKAGLYSVVVAITDGTQTQNIHHQWITDAMFIRVSQSRVHRGVAGVVLTGAGVYTAAPAGAA